MYKVVAIVIGLIGAVGFNMAVVSPAMVEKFGDSWLYALFYVAWSIFTGIALAEIFLARKG